MAIYGYARCSTTEDKQDIDRQRRELHKLGVPMENIYLEYASGTNVDRVELNKLLNVVIEGDTIITTEVSRITRSTKQLCDIIELVQQKSIKLVIQNSITIDCTNGELDPMTKAFLQISGVFAELERDMIAERVRSGMANAKSKGKVIGRPKTTTDTIPAVFYKYYPRYRNREINVTELAKLCDTSRVSIYKYLKLVDGE